MKALNVGRYSKAIVAALAAGSAVLVTAQSDGVVSQGEIVTIVLAVLTSLGVTYSVPNSD